MKKTITVNNIEIRISEINNDDYVSLTDIAKKSAEAKPDYTIQNWMKNTGTLRFLYTWEQLHNPNIKPMQMQGLMERATNNRLLMSPKKWADLVGGIGILSKPGRNGGTFAHKDIALHFCGWLSPELQVYIIKEFQRLKEEEFQRKNLEWHISKITDNVDELRALLDTIPHQDTNRNRLNQLDEPKK